MNDRHLEVGQALAFKCQALATLHGIVHIEVLHANNVFIDVKLA